MAEWREKEANFLRTFLELNPATRAESFNFVNSTPVSEVYASHAEYCNCFEPLILDETLASILRSEPLRPKEPVVRDLSLASLEPGEHDMWTMTFLLPQCRFRRDDLLVLSYKATVPNELLCGIVRKNDPVREDDQPNKPSCVRRLEVAVFRKYPAGFFNHHRLSFKDDQWTFWRVTNLVSCRREYWAIFTLQNSHLLSSVLDPRVDSVLVQRPFLEREDALRFFETEQPGRFNYSQKVAIMECQWRPNITLIQGPPGTGKTETISGIILYAQYIYRTLLMKGSPRPAGFEFPPRILICSPSNVAIDNVLERLLLTPGLDQQVVRLGEARQGCCVPYTLQSLLGPDAPQAACQELLNHRSIALSTLSSTDLGFMRYRIRPYDILVTDEAGQATELQTLIPFDKLHRQWGKCILVGDHCQLPATVLSRRSSDLGYANSLFARIQHLRPHSVLLLAEQYRMHPDIALFPSYHFYGGLLQNGPSVLCPPYTDRPYHMFHKPDDRTVPPLLGPYMFFDVVGSTVRAASGSAGNAQEVQLVVDLLRKLAEIGGQELRGSEVAVISFYSEQVRLLRDRIRRDVPQLRDVDVNTVDGFQGRQKDVVVLSCVQSGLQGQVGFLRDERRLNVAITRARFSLLIVGDSLNLLKSGLAHWQQLLVDAQDRGCYLRTEGRSFSDIIADCLTHSQGQNAPQRRLPVVPPPPPPTPSPPVPPPVLDVVPASGVMRPTPTQQATALPLMVAVARALLRAREQQPTASPTPSPGLGQWAPPWAITAPPLGSPPATNVSHGPLAPLFTRIPFKGRPFAPTLLLPWDPAIFDAAGEYSSCDEEEPLPGHPTHEAATSSSSPPPITSTLHPSSPGGRPQESTQQPPPPVPVRPNPTPPPNDGGKRQAEATAAVPQSNGLGPPSLPVTAVTPPAVAQPQPLQPFRLTNPAQGPPRPSSTPVPQPSAPPPQSAAPGTSPGPQQPFFAVPSAGHAAAHCREAKAAWRWWQWKRFRTASPPRQAFPWAVG
eukprot:GGOE01018790.1.p1 GENE.GGOE01018790.1~~GGOE01018790.1.p1  ORF type:complete len:1027 (+),score=232.61 GGOE01018790.1:61-3081(+)